MRKADWKTRDGRIKLYQGNAREILPAMPSASIDFIFADPPYGHNNNNGNLIERRELVLGKYRCQNPGRPIANDRPEANDLVRAFFRESARLLRCCCCCCCCCGGGGPDPQFARWSLWMDEVMQFKQMVVWDKGPMGMGWHYRRSYETILVAQKGSGKTRWYDRSRRVENVIRPGDYGIRKIIPRADQHPTEKPAALASHFMRLHSEPGHAVLDPFLGSGSTAVAAVRLGRRFIGIEIDATYFQTAVERIQRELAAQTAEKRSRRSA